MNDSVQDALGEIMRRRLTRRKLLKGMASAGSAALLPGAMAAGPMPGAGLTFRGLEHAVPTDVRLADGYRLDILMRWGDPLTADAPPWEPQSLSPEAQTRQFGYNNDFIGYFPLAHAAGTGQRGLLCVNHEFTNPAFMWEHFPLLYLSRRISRAMVETELAAHGISVFEVAETAQGWRVSRDGVCSRRITGTTPAALCGPARGHKRLCTSDDPRGVQVLGTLNNCGGGKTPWATLLSAEENFYLYFSGNVEAAGPQARHHRRYGLDGGRYSWWHRHFPRFNIEQEPNEPNRFGWVVELDPYDPTAMPKKRTALGRFAHESATVVLNVDGRVVVYSGDDAVNEYLYRFVSAGKFEPERPGSGRDLLDSGQLCVARFYDDGALEWLPLSHGHGPLTAENGFYDQGDVLIETRRAADLVGATPLDRPEYVAVDGVTGSIAVALTRNARRLPDQVDAANPRAYNHDGHVVVVQPPGTAGAVDHGASRFRWNLPILAGDPRDADVGARYGAPPGPGGWFACPDNLAYDRHGNLWITTDQDTRSKVTGCADGVWACATRGTGAYQPKCFLLAPVGAEVCGPEFTPDGRTLFLSIQHPGADRAFASGYSRPSTRWPDFDDDIPPRSAVIAIKREDGGEIGT